MKNMKGGCIHDLALIDEALKKVTVKLGDARKLKMRTICRILEEEFKALSERKIELENDILGKQ